jgi:adenine-specific DNA-methyltransferase
MASSKGNKGSGSSAGTGKTVTAIQHDDAKRKNIPTAEYQSVLEKQKLAPVRVSYPRDDSGNALQAEKQARNRDLDPQLVWRGKDQQDWSDLVVHAPPLYIQEKVHAKALIDDLLRETREREHAQGERTLDLFADFNGVPIGADKTEFYAHDQNWSNRMILGDSLQVMASLAEREGLRGKVQCIYFDPPYGIKFNSNFQWSTTSRDVKDGNAQHITREPEQVKAFRDTWRDGIHSYLTYLRDRLTVARELLTDSGSIFVQIGDENVHRVRALMDDVFGQDNVVAVVAFKKSGAFDTNYLQSNFDHIIWFAKNRAALKFRSTPDVKEFNGDDLMFFDTVEVGPFDRRPAKTRTDNTDVGEPIARNPLNSDGWVDSLGYAFEFEGASYTVPKNRHWTTTQTNMVRLRKANRLIRKGNTLRFARYWKDYATQKRNNVWLDTAGGGFVGDTRVYVVQTDTRVVQRCMLMSTDPGDLVLDPTCGSGTTATVAEQWGRRWITTDTSRVALALARARIMGARYPYYLLADSREGQLKEAEVTRSVPSSQATHGSIRQGFVYERVPHITLKSIANNTEIDVIWEQWQQTLEPLRAQLNATTRQAWAEWEVPRELTVELLKDLSSKIDRDVRFEKAKKLHADWWQARIARQKAIDASIAAKAEFEYLYDKPYVDNKRVRVAGPFTVESLSPHRVLGVDENDELIDQVAEPDADYAAKQSFPQMILENLKTAGVQQAHKEGRIAFTALTGWPGEYICGEGKYEEGVGSSARSRRAAIFIGPEFGTVTRVDLVAAAREARDAGFDVLIACAFNYEAHTTEFNKLADLPVLKARMNADLHMAEDLKNTGKGNLFVIFGEPDISLLTEADDRIRWNGEGRIRVRVNGVDVFRPNEGKVESSGPDEIACWFIDTDYNEESFFVRHAYFLGANDPYKSLKTTLKAEIDEDAWATLHSDTSRPFAKPKSGRIAVKVINHLGDEVMKVFRVQ